MQHPALMRTLKVNRLSRAVRRDHAARIIQRAFLRSHKEFDRKRRAKVELRHNSAAKIQARVRGNKSRIVDREFIFHVTLGRNAPSFLWGIVFDDVVVSRILANSPAAMWNEGCTDWKRAITAGDVLVERKELSKLTVRMTFRGRRLKVQADVPQIASFTAVITRLYPNEMWGFIFDIESRAVVSVTSDSPASRWNIDQLKVGSDCDLRVGTTILTVNGKLWEDWENVKSECFQLVLEAVQPKKVELQNETALGVVHLSRDEWETWRDLYIDDNGKITSVPMGGIIDRWNSNNSPPLFLGDRLATIFWEKPRNLSDVSPMYFNAARSFLNEESFDVKLHPEENEPIGIHFGDNGVVMNISVPSAIYRWNEAQLEQNLHVGDTVISINECAMADWQREMGKSEVRLRIACTGEKRFQQTYLSKYSDVTDKKFILERSSTDMKWGFSLDDETFTVCGIVDGSVAARCGLRKGSVITHINDQNIRIPGSLLYLRDTIVTLTCVEDDAISLTSAQLTPFDSRSFAQEYYHSEPDRPHIRGKMFFVDVSGEPIGLRVDGKFPVKVRSIVKDSFFDGWNQEHVEEGVKEGDWIHSIDGVVVDAGDIRVEDVAVLHNDIYKNLAVAQYIAFFRPISPSDTFSIILHREYLLLGVSSGILR